MIINVGITEKQKIEIEKIIKNKTRQYRSINNFIQTAADNLIKNEVRTEQPEEKNETKKTLQEIGDLLDKLLEDELEEKIELDKETLNNIGKVSHKIKTLENEILSATSKRNILLSVIPLRDQMLFLMENLEECDGIDEIIDIRISQIEELKDKLIKNIKNMKI